MNYFIDTEFLEGTQKEKFPISLFRKETKPTIDLISIGIVTEELNEPAYCGGILKERSYYAISKDFNLDEAWNRFDLKLHSGDRRNQGDGTYKEYWIRENVLKPIFKELAEKDNNTYFDFCNYTTEDCGFNLIVNYKKFLFRFRNFRVNQFACSIYIYLNKNLFF